MKKLYENLQQLFEENRDDKEDDDVVEIINELSVIKKRGYFTGGEFLRMGMWKSPRPKNWYKKNQEEEIREISKKVFSTNYEKRRIELLTQLCGVQIPTASAILMLTDPKHYGVIDIRVWQVLYKYKSVKRNTR
jgi:hypothetical protein